MLGVYTELSYTTSSLPVIKSSYKNTPTITGCCSYENILSHNYYHIVNFHCQLPPNRGIIWHGVYVPHMDTVFEVVHCDVVLTLTILSSLLSLRLYYYLHSDSTQS